MITTWNPISKRTRFVSDTNVRVVRSLLARVYRILKAKVALEDELALLKRGSAAPSGPAVNASRPVTRSGAAAATGPPIAVPTKPVEMVDTRKIK